MAYFNSGNNESSAENFLVNLRDDVKRVIISRHVGALRNYATTVLINGEALESEEDRDSRIRMKELWTIGSSLNLTNRQMVTLIYKGVF